MRLGMTDEDSTESGFKRKYSVGGSNQVIESKFVEKLAWSQVH
jgi:hypothetical protein